MGKSNLGGVHGFLRGSVGSVVYSVQKATLSSTGQITQVVRIKTTQVSNPKTTSQSMQRMKLAPAQKFYKALETILSNSFEGVRYGEPSRRHFMSLAMKQTGPYIPKGVTRWIPANYKIAEGSLPEVSNTVSVNDGAFILDFKVSGELVTLDDIVKGLKVAADTQITAILFTNDDGIFNAHFAGWADRKTIQEIYDTAFSGAQGQNVKLMWSDLDFDTPYKRDSVVGGAIILSRQDASGNWLRSDAYVKLTDAMTADILSIDAMNRAIASYENSSSVNNLNSDYYLNLGVDRPFDGQVTGLSLKASADGTQITAPVLVGIQTINGARIVTAFTSDDKLIIVDNPREYHVSTIDAAGIVQYNTGLQLAQVTNAILKQAGY